MVALTFWLPITSALRAQTRARLSCWGRPLESCSCQLSLKRSVWHGPPPKRSVSRIFPASVASAQGPCVAPPAKQEFLGVTWEANWDLMGADRKFEFSTRHDCAAPNSRLVADQVVPRDSSSRAARAKANVKAKASGFGSQNSMLNRFWWSVW